MADKNFLRKYKYKITNDASAEAFGGFSSVSGMTVGVKTTRYREGSDIDLFGQIIPGRPITEPITLSRGVIKDDTGGFYTKVQNAANETVEDSQNSLSLGAYILITITGKTASTNRVYKVMNPIVTSVKVGDLDALDASDDAILVESITIEHSGIYKETA